MELRELRAFTTLAEELNFRRAAERLYLSQPALSATICRLERCLGVKLFDRTSRSVQLTPAGAELLGDARVTLRSANRLARRAETVRGKAYLQLGTLFGYGAKQAEVAAEDVRKHDIRLQVQVRDCGRFDSCCGLFAGMGAAILIGPTMRDDEIVRIRLFTEDRMVLVADENDLASRETASLDEIDALGWTCVARPDDVWHSYWRLDDVRGSPAQEVEPTCTTEHEMLLAVRAGRGVASCLPSFSNLFSFDGLTPVRVDGVPPAYVDLGYLEGGMDAHIADRFALELRKAAAADGYWT